MNGDATPKGVIYTEGWMSSVPRRQYRVLANKGKLQIRIQDFDRKDIVYANGKTKVFDGVWHHVAIVTDGDTTKLFIYGVLDSADFNYKRPQYFDNIETGEARESNPKFWYNGELVEVRTWSRVLTEEEVKSYQSEPSNTSGLHLRRKKHNI